MKECSKSIARRLHTPAFHTRYFVGKGIDVGGRPDPLSLYVELFPRLESVRSWDLEDGDAQYLEGVPDGSLDFVHSSHCLEHLVDPRVGLRNWVRVIRPGGHVIVTVPDEDLYEQGAFPSTYNADHKWTFTIRKRRSWSERSINVLELLDSLGEDAEPVRIELLDSTYRYAIPRYDQSQTPVAECGIEFVIRKRTARELEFGGHPQRTTPLEDRDMRIHLNQYRDDRMTLKRTNTATPPFTNDDPI
ncbi:MAG: methyltransferase domain-containing protein [Burkholderiales bacterium]|jgi:SAM-dependent methyltransferase